MEGLIELNQCRVCKNKELNKFLSLGSMPLANSFIKKERIASSEAYFPLDVCFCSVCGMVQLAQVVDPQIMYKDYNYTTGTSEPMKAHFNGLATQIVKKFNLPTGSLIADIGSNDGTLLQQFKDMNMRVLGIEPASNVAPLARAKGIDTVEEFFSEGPARKIRSGWGQPMVITATNVFAHVNNLDDFIIGIFNLLDDRGIFVVEVPYMVEMLKKVEFDTIYHEHLSYFALRPLVALFKRFHMQIIDVERLEVHGGSIRIYVSKGEKKTEAAVDSLIRSESQSGFDRIDTYGKFAQRVNRIRDGLVTLLKSLKIQGKSIVGYGAPAKGNTLLNYCKIGTETLDYIADTTDFKQGCFSPGSHIPVISFDGFYANPPDYALLLAWNYADAILNKEWSYRQSGGKFIVPIPEPKII
ncbi:MAG: class I SAM-dependent methyltransferase [Dehalococcoidia bacterium]|jgi:novobiocin biosynthesis protein NovU/D-mycarose 3-C-methyltransferase